MKVIDPRGNEVMRVHRLEGDGMARAPPSEQQHIPVQPVDRPILCSPYDEPHHHWKYDTDTGAARPEPGRRPAAYWYKTERTGSAQMTLFAQEQQDDLPLVNLLREDVRRWREADYRGATLATRELLRHWASADRDRRLFFCQREAVETIIYLAEMRFPAGPAGFAFAPTDRRRPGPAAERRATRSGFPAGAEREFFPSLIDQPADRGAPPAAPAVHETRDRQRQDAGRLRC